MSQLSVHSIIITRYQYNYNTTQQYTQQYQTSPKFHEAISLGLHFRDWQELEDVVLAGVGEGKIIIIYKPKLFAFVIAVFFFIVLLIWLNLGPFKCLEVII